MKQLKKQSFCRLCARKLKEKATVYGRPYRKYRRRQLVIIVVRRFLVWFFSALTPGKMSRFSYLCLVARAVKLAPVFTEATIYLAHILDTYTRSDPEEIRPMLDTPRLPMNSVFEAIRKAIDALEVRHDPLAYNPRFLSYCVYPLIENEHIFSKEEEREIIASNADPTRRLKLRNLRWLQGEMERNSFDPIKVAVIASKIV